MCGFIKSQVKKIKGSPTGGIPYDTGLMMSSFTMEQISPTAVICYFDPGKILGHVRKGQVVKYYYPGILFEHRWHRKWVYELALEFYKHLKIGIEKISDKFKKESSKYKIDFKNFDLLWLLLLLQYKKLIDDMKEQHRLEEERKKKVDEQRRKYQEKIKNSVNSKQRRN